MPNNERYYDFVWGNTHFFAIDSDSDEPDGVTANSVQGQWLQNALASSSAEWQVVYFHHCPYSSSQHGSQEYMQWPFEEWGASVVLAGHDHVYERVIIDNFPYFVNGLGGRSKYSFDSPIPGSEVRYNEDYGAMLVEANLDSIIFKFYSRNNDLVDTYTIFNSISSIEPLSINAFGLEQNYPNPFNSRTMINFTIDAPPNFPQGETFVTLKVYDVLGNQVSTLVNKDILPGSYEVEFDASEITSGIYFYTLNAGKFIQTKRMIVLK